MNIQRKKLDRLRAHIKKELSLTDAQFWKFFPKFGELYEEAELRDIYQDTRLHRYKIIKK